MLSPNPTHSPWQISAAGGLTHDYVLKRDAKRAAKRSKRTHGNTSLSDVEMRAIAMSVPSDATSGWVIIWRRDDRVGATYAPWFGAAIKAAGNLSGATVDRTIPYGPIRHRLLDAQADASVEAWL